MEAHEVVSWAALIAFGLTIVLLVKANKESERIADETAKLDLKHIVLMQIGDDFEASYYEAAEMMGAGLPDEALRVLKDFNERSKGKWRAIEDGKSMREIEHA